LDQRVDRIFVDKRDVRVIPEFTRTSSTADLDFIPLVWAWIHPKCFIPVYFSEPRVIVRNDEALVCMIYLVRRDVCEKIVSIRSLLIELATCSIPASGDCGIDTDSLAVDSLSPPTMLVASVRCSTEALHKI
tara:strand:+ start:86 stop:481 length:396 start_codon:yes stop_codon:yes gene_type:complete